MRLGVPGIPCISLCLVFCSVGGPPEAMQGAVLRLCLHSAVPHCQVFEGKS